MALPLVLRLSLVSLGLFALLMHMNSLLPQALPELQAFETLFMTSPACERSTCLIGIQVGMPMSEAMTLLRGHAWVDHVSLPAIGDSNQFDYERRVHWHWSGQQPAFINANRPGLLYVNASTNIVYRIEVEASLRFGAIEQNLADTWARRALYWPANDHISYAVSYHDVQAASWIMFETEVPCPAQVLHYMSLTRTLISQNSVPPYQADTSPGHLAVMCRTGNFGY